VVTFNSVCLKLINNNKFIGPIFLYILEGVIL
jgi:hypothetical protein